MRLIDDECKFHSDLLARSTDRSMSSHCLNISLIFENTWSFRDWAPCQANKYRGNEYSVWERIQRNLSERENFYGLPHIIVALFEFNKERQNNKRDVILSLSRLSLCWHNQ